MLKKEYRYSFKNTLPSCILHTPLFTIRYQKSSDFHAAIIISKKVSGKAVTRNSLKRKIHTLFQRYIMERKIKAQMVIYCKKAILQTDPAIIDTELNKALTQIGAFS